MTAFERRQLAHALDRLGPDVDAQALETLCRLARVGPPVRRPPRHATRLASTQRVDGQAVPKPRKRIVDPAALSRFRQAHPWCAVRDCGQPAEAHHIIPRGRGGDDVPENLLPLCGGPEGHHTGRDGWHTLTPRLWLLLFGARLSVADRTKIAAARGR